MFPVLIVEDEPKIADLLKKYLQSSGYKTHWIADGNAASIWLQHNQVELVLLDLMLPGKDGLEICKELRQRAPQPPVIMLTARAEEIDRLLGLELGADDYICKPFSPREVLARIKAVLRRTTLPTHHQQNGTILGQTSIQLDRERLCVQYGDQQVILTLVEFELLETLQSYPGRIFSRQQLMERVYPDNRIVSDRTIDSHIKKLRKKINELNSERELIHSVYSVGYKFEP
ncbi:response regulator [uncultured Thiothrix sp.]|jgi:two-component system response regulator BaeR|uniref:response regulator n=1 Tax=uncultured Thiothrix sp. TaxID=223185 RepID=UPI0026062A98|nr:response regulator [uncultured Thiothrix sp.]HMT91815.1 response regulator [Thiolinea sp.]